MVVPKIRFKRGLEATIPQLALGEPGLTKDTKRVFIGSESGNLELAKKEDIQSIENNVNELEGQMVETNTRFDEIAKTNANVEVQGARGTFPLLGDRLNELTSNLAQTMHLIGQRLTGETNDNGRIQRLFNASIGGTCKITSGTYYIDPTGTTGANRGVIVPSNINIILEQDVILQALPESTGVSSVLSIVNVENVTITGGTIIGERIAHTGSTGEHGMGINILHSKNITIENVKVKDCWGDCIYVGGNNFGVSSEIVPEKITIKNCILDNSRRQGISVTLCNGATIENCRILNINGTAPQYGIDIETNDATKPCKNIVVKGCYFTGSVSGGFVIGSNAENISVDTCIFDGDNVNLNKSVNTKVTNCTLINTDISIRSSLGVVIANSLLNNSYVSIYTSADVTKNTSITGNVFQNNDGSTTRKAIELTGTDNGCFGLSINGNSFYDYISETIYFFNRVSDAVLANNMIKTNNVSRWVMLIRGFDIKVTGNNITIDSTSAISIDTVVNITAIRGSFDNNSFRLKNITPAEAYMYTNAITGELIGMTFSNNVFNSTGTSRAIKLNSSGDTKYKVMYNDFRYTSDAIQNPIGHFIYGNILSTTVSQ